MLGGVFFGAVARDALGELRKVVRVSGEEIGVVEHLLVGRDRRFEPLDFRRQPVEVTLVLVGEFALRSRSRSG